MSGGLMEFQLPHWTESGETRSRILRAAIECLHESGEAGVRVARVAERAGLTTGALYGCFRSREELILAARAQELRDSVAEATEFRRDFRIDADPRARHLEAAAKALAPEGQALRRAWMAAALEGHFQPEYADDVRRVQRELVEALTSEAEQAQREGRLRADLDPLAVALVSFTAGLGMAGVGDIYDLTSMRESIAQVWAAIVDGLRPSSEG